MNDISRDARVRALAHQIWEAEGRPDGHAERHWAMAERLVDAEEAIESARTAEEADGSSARSTRTRGARSTPSVRASPRARPRTPPTGGA